MKSKESKESKRLEIVYLPASDLVKLPGNPRRDVDPKAIERLSKLIQVHGFANPLNVFKENGKFTIIAGNHRFDAGLSLGMTEFPCIVYTGDRKAALARAVSDNKSNEWTEWDMPLLKDLLIDLDTGDFDIHLTGFNTHEIELMMTAEFQGGVADSEPQIDRAAALNEIWKCETGQLWQIGQHRLLVGDSTKAEDVARVMGGEKAALVSDPPYGISVDTSWLSALNVKRGKPSCKSDDKLANDDGTLDLSFAYKYPEWLVFGFPFVARNEKYTGLLVWDKRGDGGENRLGNPVEVAASNAFNGYRLSRHVWAGYIREAGEKREPHPTQKPIGIMVDAIQLVKNQIIFDPFSGSGSTVVACQNLNRKCRGIEISPLYCSVILQRMTDAFPGIEIRRIEP